jgi:hypothetical protein
MVTILASDGPIPKGRKGKIALQNQCIFVFSEANGIIGLAPADFVEAQALI